MRCVAIERTRGHVDSLGSFRRLNVADASHTTVALVEVLLTIAPRHPAFFGTEVKSEAWEATLQAKLTDTH